jgi:hypothetical protein
MRRFVSYSKGVVLDWIARYWPRRGPDLRAQYEQAVAQFPLVFADIALKCCAFHTTYAQGDPNESHALGSRREVWIHIATMAKLTNEDIDHLETETDK